MGNDNKKKSTFLLKCVVQDWPKGWKPIASDAGDEFLQLDYDRFIRVSYGEHGSGREVTFDAEGLNRFLEGKDWTEWDSVTMVRRPMVKPLIELPPPPPNPFACLDLVLPKRLYQEDVGDALERLARFRQERRPPWQIKLKILSTFLWVGWALVNHVVASVRGAKSTK